MLFQEEQNVIFFLLKVFSCIASSCDKLSLAILGWWHHFHLIFPRKLQGLPFLWALCKEEGNLAAGISTGTM